MFKFQVHFEKSSPKGIKHGMRTVKARNQWEAKLKVSHQVPNSFGHWVNTLANEVV